MREGIKGVRQNKSPKSIDADTKIKEHVEQPVTSEQELKTQRVDQGRGEKGGHCDQSENVFERDGRMNHGI